MTTIRDFTAFIKRHGVARQNRFRITMSLPASVAQKLDTDIDESRNDQTDRKVNLGSTTKIRSSTLAAQSISIMCTSTSLPGVNVASQEMIVQTEIRKIPTKRSYGDFDITFISSGKLFEKKIFDAWISTMFNKNHTVAYFDDIVTDILIEQLNEEDRVVYSYLLLECYPAVINPLTLDRGSTNTPQTFQVSFHFTKPKSGDGEVGTKRRAVADGSISGLLGVQYDDKPALRLPNAPPTSVNWSLSLIDVLKNIERVKSEIAKGMTPTRAITLFRNILNDINNITGQPGAAVTELADYVKDIIFVLGRK